MLALLSGEAGKAVCLNGDAVSVIRVDDAIEETGYTVASAKHLLGGATDVVVLQDSTSEKIRQLLRDNWSFDRALRLFLIAIDSEETDQDALEALNCLEPMLSPGVIEQLLVRLCNVALPAQANLARISDWAASNGQAKFIVTEISRLQERIRQVWSTWKDLPNSLFGDEFEKDAFERAAREQGVFAIFARAEEGPAINTAILNIYQLLVNQTNSRVVIAAWLKALGLAPFRQLKNVREPKGPDYSDDVSDGASSQPTHSHEIFTNVMVQQKAIEELLGKGDEVNARRYARELVSAQITQGGNRYAAKSLCRLAQLAKAKGLQSLCLEWTERATEIAPDDGWAHGQRADAYLYYGRLDEARDEFSRAFILGERFFGTSGSVRILMARAEFETALQEIRKIKFEFAVQEDGYVSWALEAEILRRMWRLEEALDVYEEGVRTFPDQEILQCGKAAVLAQLGRQREAIDAYTVCIDTLGPSVVSISGRANALLEMGLFDEAIANYKHAIESYPHESVPQCGLAEALRVKGEYQESLSAYDSARRAFPFIAIPFSGYAEVLKDLGKYDQSLAEYEAAINRFPYASRLPNGRASVLRLMGKFKEALAAYDAAVAKSPFNLIAALGQALLLKELGRLDDAIAVYERIIAQRPGFLSARLGKASVLVVQKRYVDALRLLPTEAPRTADEWIAHHIRGMILLRTDKIPEAIRLFEEGARSVPFSAERDYFQNALAVARLRLGQYEPALKEIRVGARETGKVLMMHALAALRRKSEAMDVYNKLPTASSPPYVIDLRDEIAARFALGPTRPEHDQQWLFDKECEAMLLAA